MSVVDTNQNKDGPLGGDNAKPGELPLIEGSVGRVVDVDIEKVKALADKGLEGVPALAAYLKGLLTEGASALTIKSLQEKFGLPAEEDDDDTPENDVNKDIEGDDKEAGKPAEGKKPAQGTKED